MASNQSGDLGSLLAGLAVIAIGGLALVALFDALGGPTRSKPRKRLKRYNDDLLFQLR
ncbi:MAG: hypothetical protein HY619_05730 [Thaumarchaeota archaeon]|nr:hypothetical protein [Nitrososphaerota archaeon]